MYYPILNSIIFRDEALSGLNYLAEPQPHSQQQRRQLQPQLLSNKIMDVDQHREGQVALVTGSSGFLGQHLVKLLHEKAPQFKEIRTFDIKPYKQKLGKFFYPSY